MNFYTEEQRYYCGIDLHARCMYLCILNQAGEVVLHQDLPAGPEPFLQAIAPCREDVGVESIFTWYWLADLCSHEKIPLLLGHALYMKAIHGGKSKNDKIDSRKIAGLLRGGMFPLASVYPAEMRSTRDLRRRRTYPVRQRGSSLVTSKTRTARTTSLSSATRSPTRSTGKESASASKTPPSVEASRSISS